MKKKRIWITGLSVMGVIALMLPSLVVAQYGSGPGLHREARLEQAPGKGMGPGAGWGRGLADALDLTEEQQQKVDAMRLEHRQEQLRLEGRIAGARAELDALLLDPEASRSEILKAGKALQELRGEAANQRLEHRMDLRELLTPEQRSTLVQMRARGARFGGGRGLHRGHGMQGLHRGRGMGFRCFEEGSDEEPGPTEAPPQAPEEGERL